MRGEESWSV